MNSGKKQCRHCKSEIDASATKCPQCKSDLRNWFKRHKILSVFIGIFLMIFFLGLVVRSNKPKVTSAEREQAVQDFKRLIEAAAKENIIVDMKGQGTAGLEIYVGDGWYTVPYKTKVETLKAISLVHRIATGHFMLTARDYISGKIVGETSLDNVKIY